MGSLRRGCWARDQPPRFARRARTAEKKARQLKNPVLAYFFVRDSEYCQKMDEGVLTDKAVAAKKKVMARK